MGFEPIRVQIALWTGRDLNPRLPRCERGDHTRLIYRPNWRFGKIGLERI